MTDTEPTTVLDTGPDAATERPRIRWSTLAWGLIAIAAAGWTLAIAGSPEARAGFVHWITDLGAGGWIVVGVLALGALILLQGVLALLRRTQRPRA